MYDGDIENNYKEITSEYKFITKPDCIPDSAVREGTYVIRERGFYQEIERYKEFWVKKGKWDNKTARADWRLFPNLSDKEYQTLFNIPRKCLNKEWILNINSYFAWKGLYILRRDTMRYFMLK